MNVKANDTQDNAAIVKELDMIAQQTLKGDVRDFFLDRLKHDHSPLPWNMRGQDDQRTAIDAADSAAESLVRRVLHLVQSQNRKAVIGRVKKTMIGDVIKMEVHVPLSSELRHDLFDAIGQEILMVIGGADIVTGDRGAPKVSLDQAALFPDDNDDDLPIFDQTPSGRK